MDSKKFLFVSLSGLITDIAWQVRKEGHAVRYYIDAAGERDIGDGFVDSACRTGELYDAKVAEARRANAKLHCDDRDEDLPGVAGFDSRAQRTREFAARLAMQATALLAAAEGAVQAFEQLTGDTWRPYTPPPAVSLDRRAGEVQLAAFGR